MLAPFAAPPPLVAASLDNVSLLAESAFPDHRLAGLVPRGLK